MHGEWRRRVMEKLFGVVVGEDDPQIRLERLQPLADPRGDVAHRLHHLLVLGVRHGEELRRMWQHRAADDRASVHCCFPLTRGLAAEFVVPLPA
jgi:hypothetical protein